MAVTFGLVSLGHAQMGGGMGGGMGYVPGTAFGGANDPGAIQITEGFRIIPSIMVGERYDSNVFYAPKTVRHDREDFVTTTVPGIRGLYEGSLVSVNATASAFGEYYAKNPSLSYVGTNAGATFNMDKLFSRWRPGATWQVNEYYTYTPQPPAFLTGDVNAANANPFLRGYQASRVNYQNNVSSTNASVPISQTVSLRAGYSYGFVKFGSSEVNQATLFNTTYQSYTGGIAKTLSPLDTLSVNYVASTADYGSIGSFSTRGGTLGWVHRFSDALSVNSAAGAQVVETEFHGVASSSTVAPNASVTAVWKDATTTVNLGYLLSVTPSFQFQPQPLLTHTVSSSLVQETTIRGLVGVLGANFTKGDQIGSSTGAAAAVSYTSYGAFAGLTYKFTRQTFLGLNCSYTNFDNKFGANSFAFDRFITMLSLTHAFY